MTHRWPPSKPLGLGQRGAWLAWRFPGALTLPHCSEAQRGEGLARGPGWRERGPVPAPPPPAALTDRTGGCRGEEGGEEADTPGGSVRFSPSPPPNPRLANSEGLSVLLGFLPEAEWALLPGDKAGAFLFSFSPSSLPVFLSLPQPWLQVPC